MQGGLVTRNVFVHLYLSVCLFVKRVHCDKTEKKSV